MFLLKGENHLSKLILAIVTAIRLVLFCHKLEQDYQGDDWYRQMILHHSRYIQKYNHTQGQTLEKGWAFGAMKAMLSDIEISAGDSAPLKLNTQLLSACYFPCMYN